MLNYSPSVTTEVPYTTTSFGHLHRKFLYFDYPLSFFFLLVYSEINVRLFISLPYDNISYSHLQKMETISSLLSISITVNLRLSIVITFPQWLQIWDCFTSFLQYFLTRSIYVRIPSLIRFLRSLMS